MLVLFKYLAIKCFYKIYIDIYPTELGELVWIQLFMIIK